MPKRHPDAELAEPSIHFEQAGGILLRRLTQLAAHFEDLLTILIHPNAALPAAFRDLQIDDTCHQSAWLGDNSAPPGRQRRQYSGRSARGEIDLGRGIRVTAMNHLAVEKEDIAGLHDDRLRLHIGRERHRDISEAFAGVGINRAQDRAVLWLPGTTCKQPFSSSQSSSAIQAAMQVPGCTRK